MRVDLNDAFLRASRPPIRGRTELRDAKVSGLALRISPNGTASWSVHVRTHNGKRTRPGIGEWPTIGIKAARARAREMLAEIAKGEDPAEQKRTARAKRKARAALPTVATSLAEWRETKAESWSPRYAREIERLCGKFVEPVLGKRILTETTRADWVGMIANHRAKRPTTATWLYQLASAFLNHAEAHGWIASPLLPRKGLTVIAPKVAARQRALEDDELREIWNASARLRPRARCFVRVLILTACRVSEAGGIAIGELDLDRARWTIPAARAKNGRAITLPLSALALVELYRILPAGGGGADYRLLGAIKGCALSGISQVKRKLDEHIEISPWTMHDLRRTARTGMTKLGVPAAHAEAALNHVSGRSALERTYDVHDYAPEVISALSRWQRHVAAIVGEPLAAEVVELRRA